MTTISHNNSKFTIFLGGTCNYSTWRDTLLNLIKEDERYDEYKDLLDIFNPVVKNWNEEARRREMDFKKNCNLQLYVITPRMRGIYSIGEIMKDVYANKDNPDKHLIVAFIDEKDLKFDEQMRHSIKAFCEDFVPEENLANNLMSIKNKIYKLISE